MPPRWREWEAEALPYAEKLEALAPAASHLVHMPSHAYFWVGRYREAEQSNLNAVAIDNANAERLNPREECLVWATTITMYFTERRQRSLTGDAKAGLSLAGN